MRINVRETSGKKSDQIFYLVDWLPPDFGAVGQYGAIFARNLVAAGRDVRLIGLSTGEHSTTREALPNGRLLEVTRITSKTYEKTRYFERLLWSIRTDFQIIWEVIKDSRSYKRKLFSQGRHPSCYFLSFW